MRLVYGDTLLIPLLRASPCVFCNHMRLQVQCDANRITIENADRTWGLTAGTDETARVWAARLIELQKKEAANFDAQLLDLAVAQKLAFADVSNTTNCRSSRQLL